MPRLAQWIFVTFLAGCGNGPDINLAEAVTGIYKFTATTQTDTCTPQRFAGASKVPVVVSDPGSIGLSEASATALQAYELKAADHYFLQIPREGEHINPCPGVAGDSYLKSYALLRADHGKIEVAAIEDWTLPTSCSPASVGVSSVPQSSCRAERTFTYELQTACNSPCSITSADSPTPGAPSMLTCVCPTR